MKFYLKENPTITVKADKAVTAATKLIRKMVRALKNSNEDYIGRKDDLTLVDAGGNEYEYIFKIIVNETMPTCDEYYHFNYKIDIYKKLALK